MNNMEPIPEFDANGCLPDGVYVCDEAAFRVRFVEAFQETRDDRAAICEGFFRWRQEAHRLGSIATQWVNGSFVEKRSIPPDDVDVVTFHDYPRFNGLEAGVREHVERLLGGREATKAAYRTHAFLVLSCESAHPYFVVFDQWRAYWRNWFGQTRDLRDPAGTARPGYRKGFVQMVLGPPDLVPSISSERKTL